MHGSRVVQQSTHWDVGFPQNGSGKVEGASLQTLGNCDDLCTGISLTQKDSTTSRSSSEVKDADPWPELWSGGHAGHRYSCIKKVPWAFQNGVLKTLQHSPSEQHLDRKHYVPEHALVRSFGMPVHEKVCRVHDPLSSVFSPRRYACTHRLQQQVERPQDVSSWGPNGWQAASVLIRSWRTQLIRSW